jgi:hypothetical protein
MEPSSELPYSSKSQIHLESTTQLIDDSRSFVGGIISFRALPRPQFSTLQQALFPTYFGMQTILPLILAFTYKSPPSSLTTTSTSAFLNTPSALIPITTMFLSGLTNWLILGPMTTSTMKERKHQETRDGKKYYDQGEHTEEMETLNKRFSILHGVSSLVNMFEVLTLFWYGGVLGGRLV